MALLLPIAIASPYALAGPGGSGAVAIGRGGAAATADILATRAAMDILARGGNAIDAAVAAAAVLGVTKPFWCGIGGGGFMVIYLAGGRRVITLDHNGVAPRAVTGAYLLGADRAPLPARERMTGGIAAAVPGAVLGWEEALRRYGRLALRDVLQPAIRIAEEGFQRDEEFYTLTRANLTRFRAFGSSRRLFLTPDGGLPAIGSRFTNPDLARAYRLIAQEGSRAVYGGPIGWEIVRSIQHPPTVAGSTLPVHAGVMTLADLADYETRVRPPVAGVYRGYTVYGMDLPSSGGITLALSLNILEAFDLGSLPRAGAWHVLLETERMAYADRRAFLGDPEYAHSPVAGLLSRGYAAARRAQIRDTAAPDRVRPGNPFAFESPSGRPGHPPRWAAAIEGRWTTHLAVSDRAGNIVSYTFTIGQAGGNGAVVPGFGFLLNTDLANFDPDASHPNGPAAGKRPISTMSPTLVFRDGRPVLALGSPGGGTIPGTVLETLVDVLDFGMDLSAAIAAPRVFQNDTVTAQAEPAFLQLSIATTLETMGHRFAPAGSFGLGAVAGIAFNPDGTVTAAAESVRRGGGSAMVERPR
jgi:gamma-glutamyltranspeptidase / glutathione hydrolase